MDAVILAAGLGTRLRPYTLTTPKPLLPIKGRPILDWTLGSLPPDVDRVIVVVNYLAEQIRSYLASQKHVAHWATAEQPEPRGTGDALYACRHLVRSDRLLVLNGDDLFGAADLEALCRVPAGLLAHPVDAPRQFGIVFRKPDGTLDRLVEKPNLPGPQLANIGAYLFPRSVLDIPLRLSPRGEYEITDAVSELARHGPFHVVEARFWYPISTVEAWQRAQDLELGPVLEQRR
ncbi:MAG: nucleotidyltransferase family protein [Gemmataceae bacterium]|nr:nucleotidyltransferase family protein [Gemmataceae bacterium]MDW8265608.1 nucleotidyltransferase family protein [Gemmataceae bacterium]